MIKTAKIFRNGRSQAVRLPKEFRFDTEEVFIKRSGDAVVLIPYHASWNSLFESLEDFSVDYLDDRNQAKDHQEREDLFE